MTLLEELSRECAPLLAEIGAKNHVRVILHRPRVLGKRWSWDAGELVGDGIGYSLLPDLVRMDSVRMLAGRKPMFLAEAMRVTGGELRSVTPNLRTTVGIDYLASSLGDASGSRAAVAQYIALTNNTSAPALADTATTTTAGSLDWGTAQATDGAASNSRGEYTALGVARAAAVYAHTTGVTSYTQTKQFTATGTCTNLQACGLFNSPTQGAGTLFVENTFTATSLTNGLQLTIAWTINI